MKFGQWGKDEVYGNLDGGLPLVVFDSSMEAAVVLSPLNSFMAATQTSFTNQATNETAITLGPLSSIDTVSEESLLELSHMREQDVVRSFFIWANPAFSSLVAEKTILHNSHCQVVL